MASDVQLEGSHRDLPNGFTSSGHPTVQDMAQEPRPQDALLNNNPPGGETSNGSEHTVSLTHHYRCHSGNCCVHIRHCLESASFSFAMGLLLFAAGSIVIGISASGTGGNIFLIGPCLAAAGVILLIRGCINKLAQRQALLETEQRAEREARRHMTREERSPSCRSQRNEEQALAQDNLLVPPPYEESVAPKPRTENTLSQAVIPRSFMVSAESQVNFEDVGMERPFSFATQTESFYDGLASVQSQTTLPIMHSVALSTSDLPTFIDPDTISTCPPSYTQAVSPRGSSINIYLPQDNV